MLIDCYTVQYGLDNWRHRLFYENWGSHLKECPKCFFLNPDHAEYCIKCRFHIGSVYGEKRVQSTDTRGWSSPSQGTMARSSDEPAPVDDVQSEGSAQLEAGPIRAEDDVPEPVKRDLNEEFEDRTFYEVGGYRLGGTPANALSGPPPSDFHAVLAAEEPQTKRRWAERKTKQIKGLPKPLKEPKARRPKTKRAPRKKVPRAPAFMPTPTGDLLEAEISPEPAAKPSVAEVLAPVTPEPIAEPAVSRVPAPPEHETIEIPEPAAETVAKAPVPFAPVKPAVETPKPAAESLVEEVMAPPPPKAPEVLEPAAKTSDVETRALGPEVAEPVADSLIDRVLELPEFETIEIPEPTARPTIADAPAPKAPEVLEPAAKTPAVETRALGPEVVEPPVVEAPPPAPLEPEPVEIPKPAVEPSVAKAPVPPAPVKPAVKPAVEPAPKEIAPPPAPPSPAPAAPKAVASDAIGVQPPIEARPISSVAGEESAEPPSAITKKRVPSGGRRRGHQTPVFELPHVLPGTGTPLERPRDED